MGTPVGILFSVKANWKKKVTTAEERLNHRWFKKNCQEKKYWHIKNNSASEDTHILVILIHNKSLKPEFSNAPWKFVLA